MGIYRIKNSYLKSFSYLAIEILTKLIPFLSVPIIVNHTSKSDFGEFSLYLSLLPILGIVIIGAGQKTAISRVWVFASEKRTSLLTAITMLNSFFVFLVCVVLLFIFYFLQILSFYMLAISLLVLIAGLAYAFIDLFLQKIILLGSVITHHKFYFLKQVLPYIFVLLYILLFKRISGFLLISIFSISLILVGFIVILPHFRLLFSNFHKLSIKKWVLYCLYYSKYALISAGSAFVLNFADRSLIAVFNSTKEVAEYSIAYTVGMILSLLVLALNKVWQPFILKNLKEKRFEKIKYYGRLYIILVLIFAILLSLFGKQILLFISNETYLNVADIIPVIVFGFFFYFLYTLYSNITFFYKKMHLFYVPAVIAALLNVILNLILIPSFGYKIAAWTTLISYMLEFIMVYYISTILLKVRIL